MTDSATPRFPERTGVALAIALVAAAAAVGLVYILVGYARLGQDVTLLLPGVIVGGAVRLFVGDVAQRTAMIIAGITAAAAILGFIAADATVFTPFILGESIRRLLSLLGLILLAVTVYLSYAITARRGA